MRLKYILIGAVVVAIALLGGLWLFLRSERPSASLDAFQQACIAGQRQSIAGATLPLDDATEAKLLAYCDCVAREVGARLSPQEVADIGLEQSNASAKAKLAVIFDTCRAGTL